MVSSAASAVNADAIPGELRDIPQWCVFALVPQPGGKAKKLPLVAGSTGHTLARCNDPSTLRPFELALRDARVRGLELGFAFTPDLPFFFIDADDVVSDDGDDVRPDVAALRDALGTYTEVSISGHGLHMIGRGRFPERPTRRAVPAGAHPLELYPLAGSRFCVLTGDVVPGYEHIVERTGTLARLFPSRPGTNGNGAGAHESGGTLTASEGAAIVAWAAPHWVDGQRHPMALYLSGTLAKRGIPREQALRIIEACSALDADPGAKLEACQSTYDAREAGTEVSGWEGLRDVCGLSREDLLPLDRILGAVWARAHPKAEAAPAEEVERQPFPVEIFPPAFRAYAEKAAAAVPVPVEMVAVPLLGVAASVIGNRAHLHLKRTWQEYPTFFLACVADPGKAKSGAQGLAEEPLRALQRAANRQHRTDVQLWRDGVAANKARPKEERTEDQPYPTKRKYASTDITIEALTKVLESNPGVLYSGDEFVTWVERMNQYRQGGDRGQYMSIWAHKPIYADRKTEGSSAEVELPVVCVIGGIQPDVVPKLSVEERDGFVERILPYVPVCGTKTWNRRSTTEAEEWDVIDLFKAIDAMPALDPDDESRHPGIGVAMSAEAEAEWAAWYDENNALAAEVKGVLGGFYSKLEAHVARFALVLHVLHHPEDPRVMMTAVIMRGAIVLGEWFREQIDFFVPMLGTGLAPAGVSGGLAARVKQILSYYSASDNSSDGWMSQTALYRHIHRVKRDDLLSLLDTWIDLGTVERRVISHDGRGRPTTEYRWRETISQRGAVITKYFGEALDPAEPLPWE